MEAGWPHSNGDSVAASTAGRSDETHCSRLVTPSNISSIKIMPYSSNQELEGARTLKYYVDSAGLESAFPGIQAFLNLPNGHQVFVLHYDPGQSPNLFLPQTYIPPPIGPDQMPPSTLPSQTVSFPTHIQAPPFSQQDHICHVAYRSQPFKAVVDASILKGFFLDSEEVWTVYRRNYFEVEASFTFEHLPVGPCAISDFSIAHELGEKSISGFALSLSAEETGEKPIGLIRHTPKRDMGPTLSVAQCPVVPRGLSTSNTTDKASWNRLQFRLPTRNNGKRRASQQYFHLVVQLLAEVDGNEEKATWVCIAQSRSVPLVVRGRSPQRYQASTV